MFRGRLAKELRSCRLCWCCRFGIERLTDCLLLGEFAPCLVGDVGSGKVIKECRKGEKGNEVLDFPAMNYWT